MTVKLYEYFAGLLDGAVNINADRLRQLDEHVAAIEECLRDDDDLSSVLRSFLPQGSWAQRTIIRPLPGKEFDADLLVDMKRQRQWPMIRSSTCWQSTTCCEDPLATAVGSS